MEVIGNARLGVVNAQWTWFFLITKCMITLAYLVGTPKTMEGGIFFNLFKDLSFDADDTFTS